MLRSQNISAPRLQKFLLQGVAVVAPLLFTLAIIFWIASLIETSMSALIRSVLPGDYRLNTGVGLLLGAGLLLGTAMLANLFLVRRVVKYAEYALDRVPVVRAVLRGVKDVARLFSAGRGSASGRVVSVEVGGCNLIGFVMQNQAELPDGESEPERWVAVYLPMSYQIGGYTLYVPPERVTPLDVSGEDAMRAVLTGGELFKRLSRERPAGT